MLNQDKRWMYPSTFVMSGILLTQPTQAIKFGIMFFIFWLVKSISEKKILVNMLVSGFIASIISLFWWIPVMFKSGFNNFLINMDIIETTGEFTPDSGTLLNIKGTGTRAYILKDFLIAKHQNMINNPIGIGIIVSILVMLSLILIILSYKSLLSKEKSWISITTIWFLFTLFGVNGGRLPLSLFAFRFWMLLAIPVAILSYLGLLFLYKFTRIKILKILILTIVVIGIILTSAHQKQSVNTAMWPPGVHFSSQQELQGYIWLKTLPANTPVYPYSGRYRVPLGFDKYVCAWCEDELSFQDVILYKNDSELHSFLKSKGYKYLTMGGMDLKYLGRRFGVNETSSMLPQKFQEIATSKLFSPVHQTEGMIVFKVN